VNTSFVTDLRRVFQPNIDASLQPTPTRSPRSVFALRCVKGLAISVAIGLAGSAASSLTLPQNPASAAAIVRHVKPVASAKPSKKSSASKARKASAKVSPELVKLAATAVKATKTQAAKQNKVERVAAASAKAKSAATENRHSGKGYVVRSGDSLSLIAGRQNTTVAALAKANNLKFNAPLRIGQSLSLPKVELHGPKSLPTRLRANPKRLAVRKHTAKWAKANDIPQDLLEATLWQESGFDQSKVSSTGAIGVGQIMPETAGFIEKELIGVDLNPRNTENNVRMSARYLRYLLKANKSNTTKALHAYYQGMGSIEENGLYDDTIKYARNVQALRKHFKE
jgi:soluble lytic murein transglycosylase-like protein